MGHLISLLPGALVPHDPTDPGTAVLDAVHISELADPTTYLHGGELLLTTGLSLPLTGAGCGAYVRRLVGARVAALGLGLGPVHTRVPGVLERACERHGLPLLVVPAEVPFQSVTRSFWASVGAQQERSLHATIGFHQRLVTAAASPDAAPAVLAVLAEAVGGWATLIDPTGRPLVTRPPARAADASALSEDVRRLRPAGPRSAATFPVGQQVASLHPVVGNGEALAYLGTVSPVPMSRQLRGLLLSSLALLGSDAAHRKEAVRAERALTAGVAQLVRAGHVQAAGDLADALGVPPPPPRVRLLLAAASTGDVALERLAAALEPAGAAWWGLVTGKVATVLMHAAHDWADDEHRHAALAPHTQQCALGVGPLVRLRDVSAIHDALVDWCAALPRPGVHVWRPGVTPLVSPAWADEVIGALTDEGPELVSLVADYLRHRGRWEAVATASGLHRNSVRARIARAEQVLGASLADPDTAARLWLALRATGLDSAPSVRPGRGH
ncbi:MAG: PucR family transcriptional regulator [Humibacillus sp.]|nr:PucR family transcriptional regulator [Humibacillus sp.]MDN5777394.1 PucR family transcriptional regulator [Humibacillus sp.]